MYQDRQCRVVAPNVFSNARENFDAIDDRRVVGGKLRY